MTVVFMEKLETVQTTVIVKVKLAGITVGWYSLLLISITTVCVPMSVGRTTRPGSMVYFMNGEATVAGRYVVLKKAVIPQTIDG